MTSHYAHHTAQCASAMTSKHRDPTYFLASDERNEAKGQDLPVKRPRLIDVIIQSQRPCVYYFGRSMRKDGAAKTTIALIALNRAKKMNVVHILTQKPAAVPY